MFRTGLKLAEPPLKIILPKNTITKQKKIIGINPSLFDLTPLGTIRSILVARLPNYKKEDVLGLKNIANIQEYINKIRKEETVLGIPGSHNENHMGAKPQEYAPETAINDSRNTTLKQISEIINKIV